jgi:hypothetical protein
LFTFLAMFDGVHMMFPSMIPRPPPGHSPVQAWHDQAKSLTRG